MRMTLIYSTKPDLRPLALVKSPDDAEEAVAKNLGLALEREKGRAEEKGEEPDGNVGLRWRYARHAEVEIDTTWPEPAKFE